MKAITHRALILAIFAMALPASAQSFLKGIHWGMKPKQVAVVFPGGKPLIPPSPEGDFQASTRAFGITSEVTTFAFNPVLGLRAASTRIIASGPNAKDPGGVPLGPKYAQGEVAKNAIVKKIIAVLGKPTHERQWPEGGIIVWNTKTDFIRLTHRQAADGRMDLHLWTRCPQVGDVLTRWQENFDHVFNHTDPMSWSKAGAMKLKWGMGLGDVQDVYPEIKPPILGSESTIEFRLDTYLEGQVEVDLAFHRGKLYKIRIGNAHLPYREGSQHSKDELKEWWESCDFWGGRVRKILEEKYGVPKESPAPEQEAEVRAKFKAEAGTHLMNWVWILDEMWVVFEWYNSPMQFLTYHERGDLGRAGHEAEVASKKFKEEVRKSVF